MTDTKEALEKAKKVSMDSIGQYASHWVLVLSGSIFVLSGALKMSDIEVSKVFDAWVKHYEYKMSQHDVNDCEELKSQVIVLTKQSRIQSKEIADLKSMAHPPK